MCVLGYGGVPPDSDVGVTGMVMMMIYIQERERSIKFYVSFTYPIGNLGVHVYKYVSR